MLGLGFGIPELLLLSLLSLFVAGVLAVVWMLWRQARKARQYGYGSLGAYLRAAPRNDEERALPSGERTAVILHYRQGLTVAEIASALGVSSGTVKTQLYRARRSLRPKLPGPHASVVSGYSSGPFSSLG